MITHCPEQLPSNISELLGQLGRLWAESDACPHIKKETKTAWDNLLHAWADDNSLPLLVRKGSLVRGSEIIHSSGRAIIPTDNSPAQWACHLAFRDVIPTLQQIRDNFHEDYLRSVITREIWSPPPIENPTDFFFSFFQNNGRSVFLSKCQGSLRLGSSFQYGFLQMDFIFGRSYGRKERGIWRNWL